MTMVSYALSRKEIVPEVRKYGLFRVRVFRLPLHCTCSGQIKGLVGNLQNSKSELLMVCLTKIFEF
jgi:hypothetical protein